jgi:hypothetical protein
MKPLRTPLIFGSLLLSAFALSPVRAQSDNDTPYQTKTFSGSLSNLRVETSGGSITVEGGQSGGVKVEMYVRGNNWPNNLSKDEIEDRLKDYDITLATEGNTVVALAKRKDRNWNDWKRSLSISFKVYGPRALSTDLKTSGGSIRLSKVSGPQNFATSGGSLTVTDVDGSVRGRTSGGSIHAENCGKDVDLSTSGGSIEASGLGGAITLRTSGGSLRLRDLKGQVKATTSGGSIQAENVDGELITSTAGGSIRLNNIAGSLQASTSGGSIDADIARLGQFVKLSTSAGGVRVHLPLDKGLDFNLHGNRVNLPALRNFDGEIERNRVRGRMNGGGIPVDISASAGSVTVN